MGNEVTLVSSAEETAKDLYRELVEANLLRHTEPGSTTKPRYEFVATGDASSFATLARRFLGPEVGEVSSRI